MSEKETTAAAALALLIGGLLVMAALHLSTTEAVFWQGRHLYTDFRFASNLAWFAVGLFGIAGMAMGATWLAVTGIQWLAIRLCRRWR